MRHTASNAQSATYTNLLDTCQHSRLRAALGGAHGTSQNPAQRAARSEAEESVSDATRAYLLVTAMSVISLLGLIVTSTFAS